MAVKDKPDALGRIQGNLSGKRWYQVKWMDVRFGMLYGIASMYGDVKEFNKYAKLGQLIVEDAVLPKRYVVPEGDLIELPSGSDFWNHRDEATGLMWGGCEYRDYVTLCLLMAEKRAQGLQGVAVGQKFNIGVGDGHAHYVITKVNRVNCNVEWRGFSGDRYIDMHFGWGGSFRKKDVEIYCRDRSLFAMFPGNRDRQQKELDAIDRLTKDFCKREAVNFDGRY